MYNEKMKNCYILDISNYKLKMIKMKKKIIFYIKSFIKCIILFKNVTYLESKINFHFLRNVETIYITFLYSFNLFFSQ